MSIVETILLKYLKRIKVNISEISLPVVTFNRGLAMSIIKVITERRSVREFLEKNVPDELVMKVLDAARWAPSSKNTQPWKFIIIRDQETKRKLAKLARYGWFIADAPVVIAVVTDPQKSYAHLIDGACAVQNLMLAAWELGLGTCWIGTMDREEAKKILRIPNELYLLTVMPLGYPKRVPKPPTREALENLVYYEKYGLKECKRETNS